MASWQRLHDDALLVRLSKQFGFLAFGGFLDLLDDLLEIGEAFLFQLRENQLAVDGNFKRSSPSNAAVNPRFGDAQEDLLLELLEARGITSGTAVFDVDRDGVRSAHFNKYLKSKQ